VVGPLAGETQAHVVLREEHLRDPRVDLGLVLAHPEQLRRGEAPQGAVAGERNEPLEADALFDLRALLAGALVVPEDRRAEHAVVSIEADEPVHLAGEADPGRVHPEPGEGDLARADPVVRILLAPARVRRRERVRLLDARDHLAGRGDGECLDAGRPDVDADERSHHASPD
jgi:hypothetical protein